TDEFTREVVERLSGRPGTKIEAPATRSRKRWLVGWGGAAAAAVAALFWLMPGPEVDPRKVIVFPLMDQRANRVDQAVGEQVAIMVGTALEHAEPLRWIDGWDWLSPSERTDMSSWSIRSGAAIARQRGAGYVIDGRIMDEGDSVSVILRLHDAASGEQVQTSLLSGGTEELPSLGRQALVALLPNLIDPGRSVGSDAFEGFAPEVVADWLNGEREYRESRFETALASFQSAVDRDSTMALAAIRGAQAARWLFQNDTAAGLLEVALANEASLSARNRALASGIQSYVNGEAAEAERTLRGIATDYPEWSDAWMALGEVYYHLPTLDQGIVRAEDAFKRALLSDPGFTPPLVHLSEIAYRRGDADLGDSLRAAFPVTGDRTVLAQLDLMSTCVRSGAAAPEWSRAAGSDEGGEAVLYAGAHLAVGGAFIDCSIGAFEALHSWGGELEGGGVRNQAIAMAWSTLLGLQGVHAARGHHERVHELISGADQFERPRDYLWVLASMAGLPLEQEAREAVARLESPGEPSATALWMIGAWHALHGEPQTVAQAARTARDRSRTTPPDSVAIYALLADALDAWSSLARADTTEAIERLAALAPVSPPSALQWSLWEPLPVERLALARLSTATGDFEGAVEAASAFDHPQPVVYVGFVAESLRLRMEASEMLGDPQLAEGYRARLARLR
ncbi:MAG: hypothetical protein R3195_20855, partial [Gemmatimonadota bacterium]|nr:hypothetical protein [Gemmatimonadota bacterium]